MSSDWNLHAEQNYNTHLTKFFPKNGKLFATSISWTTLYLLEWQDSRVIENLG